MVPALKTEHGESWTYKFNKGAPVSFTVLGVSDQIGDTQPTTRGRIHLRQVEIIIAIADVASPNVGATMKSPSGEIWMVRAIADRDSVTATLMCDRPEMIERSREQHRFNEV